MPNAQEREKDMYGVNVEVGLGFDGGDYCVSANSSNALATSYRFHWGMQVSKHRPSGLCDYKHTDWFISPRLMLTFLVTWLSLIRIYNGKNWTFTGLKKPQIQYRESYTLTSEMNLEGEGIDRDECFIKRLLYWEMGKGPCSYLIQPFLENTFIYIYYFFIVLGLAAMTTWISQNLGVWET